jgi:hypothetical protein
MTPRAFILPNGRACGVQKYCDAWRTLKTMLPTDSVKGWDHFPEKVEVILREIRRGIHDRINRHMPGYGVGRKWGDLWQTDAARAARDLNTPRLAIRWLPGEWRDRFRHRIS